MPFQYNGIVLQEPLFTVNRQQKVVTDAAKNYLFTEHRCHVRGTFNPSTTSYRGAALSVGGQLPAITETAVRHALQQSRGSLIIQDGAGNTILRSPVAGASVDANNGPVTEINQITAQYGSKTFVVDFVVTTWINEASLFVTTPSVLISHLYQMRHTVDCATMLCTRTTHGEATFRPDRLAALGNAVPDDFRQYLFLPVPQNFRRAHIDVVASEDNTMVAYTVVDQEMALNINPALGVTLIEGSWTQSVGGVSRQEYTDLLNMAGAGWIGRLNGGLNGVASLGGMAGSIKRNGVRADDFGSGAAAGQMIGDAAWNVKEALVARGNAPRITHTLNVGVWGDRNASGQTLRNVAVNVIFSRLNQVLAQNGVIFTGVRGDVRCSIDGRYVEATCVVIGPPLGVNNPNQFFLNTPVNVFEIMNFGQSDDVPGYLTTGNGTNPAPSGDTVSRGTYLGRCVAAALLGQNSVPPSPNDPVQANVLQPP